MRLLKVLFVVTLVGIAGCDNGEAARRKQMANNLRQIGLALHASYAQEANPVSNNEAAPSDEAPTTEDAKSEDKAVEAAEPDPSAPK